MLPGEGRVPDAWHSGPRRRGSEGLHAPRHVSAQPARLPEPGPLDEGLAVLSTQKHTQKEAVTILVLVPDVKCANTPPEPF